MLIYKWEPHIRRSSDIAKAAEDMDAMRAREQEEGAGAMTEKEMEEFLESELTIVDEELKQEQKPC